MQGLKHLKHHQILSERLDLEVGLCSISTSGLTAWHRNVLRSRGFDRRSFLCLICPRCTMVLSQAACFHLGAQNAVGLG